MGRASAVTPATFTSFGALLRYLRLRLDMNQRDLAIAVGYSESQISRLEQNQRLPDPDTLLARFVPALELNHEPELVARMMQLAQAARTGEKLPPLADATPVPAPAPPLPAPPNALLGREQLVADAAALLRTPDVRLLTMTGPGGIGKTRLALAVATALIAEYNGAAVFVSLATVTDAALVTIAITQALGVAVGAGQAPETALQHWLRDRTLLLLLDNFEQVSAAAPLVSRLLATAAGLRVVVTSRSLLRIYGEHDFAVPPLVLPRFASGSLERPTAHSVAAPLSLRDVAESSAAQLFVDRAQAARPGFRLTVQNARTVAAICTQLDGIPLAIELAAARLRMLSPQALLARLHDMLEALAGGPRDLPARQRTLRGALAWSYDLLSPAEQIAFRRLGVFSGGFTAEAAALLGALPAAGDDTQRVPGDAIGARQADIVNPLASLLDHSLLQLEGDADSDGRFGMLETIRAYALERLADSGEEAALRRAHALYYTALAEEAERRLAGASHALWLDRLDAERDNLRAALAWTLEDSERAELAMRLVAALWKFWRIRSRQHEGRRCLDAALALAGATDHPTRASALYGAGWIAHDQGDFASASAYFEASLRLNRAIANRRGVAESLHGVGEMANFAKDYERARALFEESLILYRELDDPEGLAWTLDHLGLAAYERQDYRRMAELLRESVQRFRALGHGWGIATTLAHQGLALAGLGDYAGAAALFAESRDGYHALGNRFNSAVPARHLGEVLIELGEYAQARDELEASLALFLGVGNKRNSARAMLSLARVALATGDIEQARLLGEVCVALLEEDGDAARALLARRVLGRAALAQDDHALAEAFFTVSLHAAVQLDDAGAIAGSLTATAQLRLAEGRAEEAVQLLGAAFALLEAGARLLPSERRTHDHVVARARADMAPESFRAAWERGAVGERGGRSA